MPNPTKPQVFIVGGGFAGLAAARALAGSDAEINLLDRKNHHVFQPLLYQVATASLSPADISAPIRSILRKQANCRVVLAEVTNIDLDRKRVYVRDGYAHFDYLILAAGATHAYFGNDHWERLAPGLKTLEDATELRRRILLAYESAEYEGSEAARRARLTFAIVGAGPTGVELAGAIKEIAGRTLPKDYRNIDTRTTRVILFQSGDRVLPQLPPDLSQRAATDLQHLGVEIRLQSRVTNITEDGLFVGDEFVPVKNIFWAAGVQASPLGKIMGVEQDRAGRIVVGSDLAIPGHPNVFVVGDMAAAISADTGKSIPGVAQAGMQMGRYAGKVLASEIAGKTTCDERLAFSYFDKGNMAIIGRTKAVAEIGRLHVGGFIAWLIWSAVHVMFLVSFRNRLRVMLSWMWSWLLNSRDARLITGHAELEIEAPPDVGFVAEPWDPVAQIQQQKQRLRLQAKRARQQIPDRQQASQQVISRLLALPELQQARCVAWYVDTQDEVQTREAIGNWLATQAASAIQENGPATGSDPVRLVVPYCQGDELRLTWIRSLDDLAPGRFGIWEPKIEWQQAVERQVAADELDLILLPGVAFDRRGGRIGYGQGFYDRLLATLRPTTPRVGLAFDCQLVDKIPQEPHDLNMDIVITQSTVHRSSDL